MVSFLIAGHRSTAYPPTLAYCLAACTRVTCFGQKAPQPTSKAGEHPVFFQFVGWALLPSFVGLLDTSTFMLEIIGFSHL